MVIIRELIKVENMISGMKIRPVIHMNFKQIKGGPPQMK